MSKKIQSGVICMLLAGKKFVFEDMDTINEIYGLGPEMFNVPNKWLTANELASIQAMMASVEKAVAIKDKFNILEGARQTSFKARQEALTTWFQKQKVSHALSERIDAVWTRLELSPLQLIQEMPKASFPDVRDAEPAREDIALAICGDGALGTTLRGDFREAFNPIIHHNWERHHKRYLRAKDNMNDKKEKAHSACKVIEEGTNVTAANLRDATRAVKTYSESIRWFPLEVEEIEGVGELEEFLKHIVVGAVAKAKGVAKEKLAPDIGDGEDGVDNTPASEWFDVRVLSMIVEVSSSESRGRARARSTKPVHLHPGEVNQIWPAYVQLFRETPTEPEAPNIESGDESGADIWAASNDLGVSLFRHLDDAALNHMLHFPDGRPALFAEFRSISRKCSWDKGVSHLFVKENNDMLPLALLWHQHVGVASLVEKIWQPVECPHGMPGTLIADEVGVGKTALVMGTIAFIIDTYWVDQIALGPKGRAESLPAGLDRAKVHKAPILDQCPFFVGQKSIPDLPHIIIVPNSLLAQWTTELRTFFAPQTIEIYHFPSAAKDFGAFWTGAWAKSKMPFINRIILVTHLVGHLFALSF
ncbi:hypothetical protein BDR05DRAFT_1002399 [Suillus weaverae]|nr:hypothetical protein BDR05DRAFT_1002399 [Suillus weaverae]